MSEFCKKCIEEVMGIYPDDPLYEDWLVKDDFICEGCGYEYLGDDSLNTELIVTEQ